MTIVVSIDGRIVLPEQATISVFDRGFLYGDSVFETIRTYQGRPFALDEHLARLEKSAQLVFIAMPVSRRVLTDEIAEALGSASNPESYLRVMVTRGQGELGLDPALAEKARRVVIVGPLHAPPPEAYRDGVSVVTFRTQRPNDSTGAEGAKIGNYLVAVLGVRAARQVGAHEALIVAAGDRVVEGASSNVFCVRGNTLVTPGLDAGILAGITRERVLAVASDLGLDVRFDCPTVEELLGMDEVFISSSIRELLPVVRVDGTTVGDGRPGAITTRLHEAFLARVGTEMGL